MREVGHTSAGSTPIPRGAVIAAGVLAGVLAVLALLDGRKAALVFALAASIPVLAVILPHPRRVFLLMLFTLPVTAFGVLDVGVSVTLTKALGALLLLQLVLFAPLLGHRVGFALDPHDRWLLLFLGYVALSWPLALVGVLTHEGASGAGALRSPAFRSAGQVVNLLLMVGIYFAVKTMAGRREMLDRAVRWLFVSFLLVCLYGLYQFLGSFYPLPLTFLSQVREGAAPVRGPWNLVRVASTMDEPKGLAHWLLPVILLLLTFSALGVRPWSTENKYRGLLILFCGVFLLTFSRSGYVMLCGCLVLFFLMYRGQVGRTVKTLGGAAVVLLIVLTAVSAATRVNLGEVIAYQVEVTTLDLWKRSVDFPKFLGAVRMLREHPVFGVGLGNYNFYFRDFLIDPIYALDVWGLVEVPPSAFLGLLVENGVVGFLLFMLFLGYLLRDSWRAVRRHGGEEDGRRAAGFLSACVAVLVVLVYGNLLTMPLLWIWAGLLSASVRLCAR